MDTAKRKILIVDDNEINRMILADMLEDEFDIAHAKDGLEAIELIREKADELTLILLDIVMPRADGFEVLETMDKEGLRGQLPVIMISSETESKMMQRAFDLGAADYVNRPFDQAILRRRIVNTIMLYAKQKTLTNIIIKQIRSRERESNLMVGILSNIVEFRNGESGAHVRNIKIISKRLIERIKDKTDAYDEIFEHKNEIVMASSLHDIGKIGIPEGILNKPGKLSPAEFEIMKTHSVLGSEMIEKLPDCKDEYLVKYAYQICRWHHERYDGKGYPDRLKGEEIPIAAQIVSLADVYDALTSERCYKPKFSHEKSMNMIMSGECGQFNPLLLECLQEMSDAIAKGKDFDKDAAAEAASEDSLRREIQRMLEI